MTPRISLRDGSSSVQVMRVSNGSDGCYEDVILRPKGNEHNRRLARPLAVLSGLFKSNRENGVNHEENLPKLPAYDGKIDRTKLKKRTTWNFFKSKRKTNCAATDSPSFQHFQEPLNIERLSLPIGPAIDTDLEWYDLNKEEMSLFEARMSDIVNEFNNYSQTSGESEPEPEPDSESLYRCNLGQHLTISSNILWSHNLSCQSTGNASNINLLGANVNKDQMHSDIYIETGEIMPHNVCDGTGLNSSFVSTDSDGYVVMQPVRSKKYIEPAILIDGGNTNTTMDPHCHYDSDESSHLSSGFGSDAEATPQKSLPFINSPPTSDFSDAFTSDKSNVCSPASPLLAKSMQKMSKKRRLRIQSRKLLGMLHVKSPSQTKSNVMATQPPNKSPLATMKKPYKGTPFKVRLSKQADEKDIIQPFHSLQI